MSTTSPQLDRPPQPAAAPEAGEERPDRRGRAWTLAATTLGFAVVQLDVSVVNVASSRSARRWVAG